MVLRSRTADNLFRRLSPPRRLVLSQDTQRSRVLRFFFACTSKLYKITAFSPAAGVPHN